MRFKQLLDFRAYFERNCSFFFNYISYVLDQESRQQFTNIIQEISGYEGNVQRDREYESFYHVSGEQIRMGKTFMTKTSDRKQNYLLTPVNWFILFWIFSVVAFVVFVLMGFFLQSHEVKIYLS